MRRANICPKVYHSNDDDDDDALLGRQCFDFFTLPIRVTRPRAVMPTRSSSSASLISLSLSLSLTRVLSLYRVADGGGEMDPGAIHFSLGSLNDTRESEGQHTETRQRAFGGEEMAAGGAMSEYLVSPPQEVKSYKTNIKSNPRKHARRRPRPPAAPRAEEPRPRSHDWLRRHVPRASPGTRRNTRTDPPVELA